MAGVTRTPLLSKSNAAGCCDNMQMRCKRVEHLGGGMVVRVMLSWRPPVMHNGRTQTGRRAAQGDGQSHIKRKRLEMKRLWSKALDRGHIEGWDVMG